MRQCVECGIPIGECMGSVHPGDFVALCEGFHYVGYRELCGKCTLFYQSKNQRPKWVRQRSLSETPNNN